MRRQSYNFAGQPLYSLSLSLMQRTSNCQSIKLAVGYDSSHAHENYTSITKTLSMNWDNSLDYTGLSEDNLNTSFTVKFMTESVRPVEFKASILGEKLDETYQVNIVS